MCVAQDRHGGDRCGKSLDRLKTSLLQDLVTVREHSGEHSGRPLKLDALQPIRVLTGLQLGDWYQTFAVTPWSLVSLLDKLPSLASLSFEEGPKSIVTKMARRDNFRKSSVRFLIMTA